MSTIALTSPITKFKPSETPSILRAQNYSKYRTHGLVPIDSKSTYLNSCLCTLIYPRYGFVTTEDRVEWNCLQSCIVDLTLASPYKMNSLNILHQLKPDQNDTIWHCHCNVFTLYTWSNSCLRILMMFTRYSSIIAAYTSVSALDTLNWHSRTFSKKWIFNGNT